MRQLKFGIPALGALTIVSGLFGCADENPWGNTSKEKGSISISISTNSEIATARPIFRSGEESRANDPNDLNTYINVPTAADFKVKLEKADGSYSKTWNTLADFKNEAASTGFNTGAYTMTAYFGKKGTQDFEAPYFEASSSFTVLSDKTHEVNLEAELKNSMVKINYTQAFKDYMSNFYAMIHTEGLTDDITYGMVESRPAFIEPNKANVTVHFTTKDKGYTSSVSLGEFAPAAKTLHNITFDIVESQNGTASLNVSFDETLEDEDIKIDLTDELFTSPAPTITCEGFSNGETLDMLEGTGSNVTLKMNVKAEGKIKSAVLTVDSDNFTPSWGKEYDLCKAFADNKVTEIKNAGIDVIGFGFTGQPTDMEGYLTLTDFGKSLPKGVHTISLTVTDQTGKVSDPATVILNSEEITIDMVGKPTIVYGSGQAVLTLDYNGINPDSDISFMAVGPEGYYDSTTIKSCEEITATRAFEQKRYVYTIELPVTTKSTIGIQVYHKETKKVGEFQVPVTVPPYQIVDYDAFTNYAHLKVTTPNSSDPSVLAAVINNLVVEIVKVNGGEVKADEGKIANRDTSKGIVTLSGLTPATAYTITSSITGDAWNTHDDVLTTESEEKIPNGDFSTANGTVEMTNLNVGGKWHSTALSSHQHTSSFFYNLPSDWTTINDETAYYQSSNKNTWYIVPSSWINGNCGIMRNVGYNHNGRQLKDTGNAGNSTYYCTDHPSEDELNKAAGVLSLGSYNFTTGECEGIKFSSRPSKITFDYEYNNEQDKVEDEFKDDIGYAYIELLDIKGGSLGSQVFDIKMGKGSETISFKNYGIFQPEAGRLKIVFKSSKSSTPPIHIPTNKELNEGTGLKDVNITQNDYHALATGSILKITNVVAHYGDETPAAAPKKSTIKKR